MQHNSPNDHHLLRRVRAEYLEMPGLTLTLAQARRLWQLDEETCTGLLHSLVDAGFLTKTHTGGFRRMSDGTSRQARVNFPLRPRPTAA